MHSILREIIDNKSAEVTQLQKIYPQSSRVKKSLAQALRRPGSIIAEIKRRSPAHGLLSDIKNPSELAHHYIEGGASAISVLTDNHYFNGSIDDMKLVSESVSHSACPILRKDFIIETVQLMQAAAYGADAVLLIAAVLKDKTQMMIDAAEALGLEVLLEVHTKEELSLALDTSAKIIGVNNRNLHSLEVSVETSLELIKLIPTHIISVSESGIHDALSARKLFDAGFSALLVGEALVRSEDPASLIEAMRGGCHDSD